MIARIIATILVSPIIIACALVLGVCVFITTATLGLLWPIFGELIKQKAWVALEAIREVSKKPAQTTINTPVTKPEHFYHGMN